MCKSFDFLHGLFIGTIIGSAIGFLCAPESGEEMRKKIKDSTTDAFDDIKSKVDQYDGDIRRYLDDVTSGVTNKFQEYKEQLEKKIDSLQNEVNADIAELNKEREENERQNLDTVISETDHD